MANFVQWMERFPENKRITFICGSDNFLIDYVYDKEMSTRTGYSDLNVTFLKGTSSKADLEVALNQFSSGDRLVVLKDFHKIKDSAFILDWLNSRFTRNTSLLCVSNESKPDTKLPLYKAFIEKGRFVDCKPLTYEGLVQFVKLYPLEMSENIPEILIGKLENPRLIINTLQKLSYLGLPINEDILNRYIFSSFDRNFVELLMVDKNEALKICSFVKVQDLPLIIGTLEYTLTRLLLLVRNRNVNYRDIPERTGIPLFLLKKYLAYCKGVSEGTIINRIKNLVNLDMLYRKNNIIGSLERFVHYW